MLTVGISFYTFHEISYTVDVYRRYISLAARNFEDFETVFISFFPQLVAGPIGRASWQMPQFGAVAAHDVAGLVRGRAADALRIFQKICAADRRQDMLAPSRTVPGESCRLVSAMLPTGLYCFSDSNLRGFFLGYTDIARGLARLMGFELIENFNQPYFASNITDFWRRWHISLSTWLRDYLYIPLGGNRHGKFNTYRNLFLTMFLGGLWHGASWKFAVWGTLAWDLSGGACICAGGDCRSGGPGRKTLEKTPAGGTPAGTGIFCRLAAAGTE